MEFSLEVRKVDAVAIFDLSGRLCVGSALLSLRSAVRQALDDGTNRLVINMGGVTFIDSSGLGELITTHSSVQNGGGAMNILSPNKRIRDLMQMTGLDKVFQSFDDETLSIRGLKN